MQSTQELSGSAQQAVPCWASLVPSGNACVKDDKREQRRIRQQTGMLVTKSAQLVMELQFMRAEIRAQRGHIEQLQNYEQAIRRISGDQMMNPMPSLLAVYEQAPTLAWAREGKSARQRIRNGGALDYTDMMQVDLRARAEGVFASWAKRGEVEKAFGLDALRQGQGTALSTARNDESINLAIVLQEELGAVQRNRASMQPAATNVRMAAQRTASRYQGATDPGGEAEADISNVSAQATANRATAQQLRREKMRQSMESLRSLQRARSQLERDYRTARPGGS